MAGLATITFKTSSVRAEETTAQSSYPLKYAVIAKHEFGDPEIAAADHSPDRKTLLVGLDEPALLNVVPAADPLARLRIIKHGILAVDFVFGLEIARVRSIPMALQRRPHGSIIHLNLPVCACGHYFGTTEFTVREPNVTFVS